MAYSDRRALVLARNFSTFGVAATVTRPAPDDTPIPTSVIWLTPSTEDAPANLGFARKEGRRVVGLLKADVPTCPIGTLIVGPTEAGGADRGWRVVGFVLDEAEHVRVSVVDHEEALG